MALRSASEVLSGLRSRALLSAEDQAKLTGVRTYLDSHFTAEADAGLRQAMFRKAADLFNRAWEQGPIGEVSLTFSLGSANLTAGLTEFATEEVRHRCAAAGLQVSRVEANGKDGRVTVSASYDLNNIKLGDWGEVGLTLLGDGGDDFVDTAKAEQIKEAMSTSFAEQVTATQTTVEQQMWFDIREGMGHRMQATAALSTSAMQLDHASTRGLCTSFDALYQTKLAIEAAGYTDVKAVQEGATIKLTSVMDLAPIKAAVSAVAREAYEKNKGQEPVVPPEPRQTQGGWGYSGWSSPRPSAREPEPQAIALTRTR
jgi:hypothetical protein